MVNPAFTQCSRSGWYVLHLVAILTTMALTLWDLCFTVTMGRGSINTENPKDRKAGVHIIRIQLRVDRFYFWVATFPAIPDQ